MQPLYPLKSFPWLDIRVFYIRLSNCEVNDSIPEYLTLNHIPLTPDTILDMNGRRSNMYTECVSSTLKRDRVDMKSEEATFVSTDNIAMNGSARFEVYNGEDLLLSGVLELCNANSCMEGIKYNSKKWNMRCQSKILYNTSFIKMKHCMALEVSSPKMEVYVTGSFSGMPIILTETLQYGLRKKPQMKIMLNSIPEHETADLKKEHFGYIVQESEYQSNKPENDVEVDYNSIYSSPEYGDGELSWFNAGVRVGVGIGLGVCLGIGISVGLLVRTYQSMTKGFKRRPI